MKNIILFVVPLTLISCYDQKSDANSTIDDINIKKKSYTNFYRINDYSDSNAIKLIFDLISKAQAIDSDPNLKRKKHHHQIPQKKSIFFTINDTLKKIAVQRRDLKADSNGVIVHKPVPFREIFFIDEMYTIFIYPKFGNEIPENKWEWNRIIMYKDSMQVFIGQNYRGQKGVIIPDTTDIFRTMATHTVELLEELKEQYK